MWGLRCPLCNEEMTESDCGGGTIWICLNRHCTHEETVFSKEAIDYLGGRYIPYVQYEKEGPTYFLRDKDLEPEHVSEEDYTKELADAMRAERARKKQKKEDADDDG